MLEKAVVINSAKL